MNKKQKTYRCRICFCDGNFEGINPLISPCKCSGSVKYIHLNCLRKWLTSKITTKVSSTNDIYCYVYKSLKCEICQSIIPEIAEFRGKFISLLDFKNIDSPYIILQSMYQYNYLNKNTTDLNIIFVISLKTNNYVNIGRANNSNIRLSDVSVSRNHAKITFSKGDFYLEDIGSKFGTLVLIQNNILFLPNKNINIQTGKSHFLFKLKRTSIFLNPKTIEEKEEEIDVNMKKKNSVSVHMKKTKSISQMVQEPLMTFGNLIQRKISFNDSKDENFSNENSTSNENKKDRINSTDINYKDKDITTNENIIDNNEYLDLDSYFNESFKIYYLTPIILELSSDLFLENINMCIYMKWFNEINRYLKILISIPENIYINKYFEVKVKIKNISFNPMNIIIQIKDNENKDTNLDFKSNTKIVESVPSILSQTKIEHLGLIDCDDEKIYNLKFLPYIKGYCYLPNITLTDIYSDRQFYIVQSNKIFVKEN